MQHYFVNKSNISNPRHNHEVHKAGICAFGNLVPLAQRLDLGEHASANAAVASAKKYYADADGCALCCPEAHRA